MSEQPKETESTISSEPVENTDDPMAQVTAIEHLETQLEIALLAVTVEQAKVTKLELEVTALKLKVEKIELRATLDTQAATKTQRDLEKRLSAANTELKSLKNRPKSKLDAELEQIGRAHV